MGLLLLYKFRTRGKKGILVTAFILWILSRWKTRMSTGIYNFTCCHRMGVGIFFFQKVGSGNFLFLNKKCLCIYSLYKHTMYIPDVPRNVHQLLSGYSLAYFEWKMFHWHGSLSQLLRSSRVTVNLTYAAYCSKFPPALASSLLRKTCCFP
jgi:hypothetical protein